jgi:MtrB/PioB family decaheme-associated outer membrane protein
MRRFNAPRSLRALVAFGLAFGHFAPSPAAAETEVAGGTLTGYVEGGGRIVVGDRSSAQFDEYTDHKTGPITSGNLLFEEGLFHTNSIWDFKTKDDQSYLFDIGQYGIWGFEVDYMNYRHRYSKNSVSPFSGLGGNFLALPDTWDYAAANADLGQELAAGSNLMDRNLRFRIIDTGARAYVKPSADLEFSTAYHLQDKHGNRPKSITFGFGSFDSIAQPVDERTHQVTANAKLAKETWSAELEYLGSIFDNDNKSFFVENPLQEFAADGTSNLGRQTVSPNNQAHQLSLSSAAILPTSYPSRVAGTVSYGMRLQDDDFIPYTSNNALTPGPLPRNDLDGKVQTILGNLSYTARPTRDVDVRARYRIYDLDDQSNKITFDQRVPYDNAVSPVDLRAKGNSYTRQNVDLDASYRIAKAVKVTSEFGWESWDRSNNRDARHTNEYGGGVGFDIRPARRVRLQTGWGISYRKLNSYQQLDPAELPQLRKYDLADRLRNELSWRAFAQFSDEFSGSLSGSFAYDDYDDTRFGLTDGEFWNVGVDLDYVPASWLSLSGWYAYDVIEYKQRSMDRGSDADLPSTTPENIWKSKADDDAHTAGVNAVLTVVPDWLDIDARYVFQKGRAKTRSNGNPNSGNPVNWPAIKYTLHQVETEVIIHAHDRLDLITGYAFQRGRYQNFQTDPLGVNLGGNDIYLNNKTDDYAAHVVSLTARYEF